MATILRRSHVRTFRAARYVNVRGTSIVIREHEVGEYIRRGRVVVGGEGSGRGVAVSAVRECPSGLLFSSGRSRVLGRLSNPNFWIAG